ncbi:MAG: DUF58 domain-containing protein [Halioglobus sp.]|nr:DUF58 domain-containing protein [Halioglobus sp.]
MAGSFAAQRALWYQRLQERFRQWVNRRIPPAREVTLDQRRIFIFPSWPGIFFLFCLLVMLLTAVNFQNNLTYAVTFLLATLFVIAILHTYANLSGLTIRAVRAAPAFPGQQSEFELLLSKSRRREHYGLHVQWPESSEALVNLAADDEVTVRLHMPVTARGWFRPGRLLLESTYPMGLLRCWTWVDLDLHALVYPKPLPGAELPGLASDSADGADVPVIGSDDFYGIRDYQRGDSLRHVHWKALAKGQGLQSKQYTAYAERSVWLDWDAFGGLPVEQRLSHLCYWALQLDAGQEDYGLRLPGVVIEPARGDRHREAVLRALALHGVEDEGR